MSERKTRHLTAGLGGMALALLMLALVVRQVQAADSCSVCCALAVREADNGPCKGLKYGPYMSDYQYCAQTYMMTKCYGGPEPRPCPGPAGDNGVVRDCSSEECRFVPPEVTDSDKPCGDYLTAMGGGTICDNACYAQSCGEAKSSTTCRDVQLQLPPGTQKIHPSPCYVTCGCRSN